MLHGFVVVVMMEYWTVCTVEIKKDFKDFLEVKKIHENYHWIPWSLNWGLRKDVTAMCTSGSRHHRVRGQRYSGLEACKIEKEIENFVENFKKKGSALDQPPLLERPPSLESCSSSLSRSSRPSSSLYSSDFTDESPEKTGYLMPEIVRRYRYCSTTTTSDSEGGEEDFRRLLLAYKDSKKHTGTHSSHTATHDSTSRRSTIDTATSSTTEGPDGFAGKSSGLCSVSVE